MSEAKGDRRWDIRWRAKTNNIIGRKDQVKEQRRVGDTQVTGGKTTKEKRIARWMIGTAGTG